MFRFNKKLKSTALPVNQISWLNEARGLGLNRLKCGLFTIINLMINIEKKKMVYAYRLALTVLNAFFLFGGNIYANNVKELRLHDKITEIQSLCDEIVERKEQAIGLREKLEIRMAELEMEIKNEQKSVGKNSYHHSIRNPRIANDIKLIQKISAYITRINEKIEYLEIGIDELRFLYHHAADNLKVFETLNDIYIEELMGQIDKISKTYEAEANNLLIKMDDIVLIQPERIWNKALRKK